MIEPFARGCGLYRSSAMYFDGFRYSPLLVVKLQLNFTALYFLIETFISGVRSKVTTLLLYITLFYLSILISNFVFQFFGTVAPRSPVFFPLVCVLCYYAVAAPALALLGLLRPSPFLLS